MAFSHLTVVHAAIALPTGLNNSERQEITRILGWGTSSKLLTDPYSLGGYVGFEVGLAYESIAVDQISRMGVSKVPEQERFSFPKITIGKGLYNNIDTFLHFIPFNESTGLSEYGGLIKWMAYEMSTLPASFSLVLHANSANAGNVFVSQSYGLNLVSGLSFDDFSFYFGGGSINSTGRFLSLSSTESETSVTVSGFHTILGLVYHLGPFFTAMQIDQYNDSVWSFKLGTRL